MEKTEKKELYVSILQSIEYYNLGQIDIDSVMLLHLIYIF
jgi:hypothetical protein